MMINNFSTTPIQKLYNCFHGNEIFVKRDDLLPFSFGGNKARKAILFFKDIHEKRANAVVTYGSSSSNHCRVIANISASMGLPCYIIAPEESSHLTSNSKLIKMFGANVIICPKSDVSVTINNTVLKLEEQGYNPYFIQGGGHGNLGTQAYVNAYDEIRVFEEEMSIQFDYIFVTSGTGTTQAGLVCGKLMNKDFKEIIGISNARRNPRGADIIKESIEDYFTQMGIEWPVNEEINFIDDYILDGYGSYNKEILLTIVDMLTNEGIPLDTTYTGKAYWGMKKYIEEKGILDKKILFIHTGGTPLFFDRMEELLT